MFIIVRRSLSHINQVLGSGNLIGILIGAIAPIGGPDGLNGQSSSPQQSQYYITPRRYQQDGLFD